MNKLLPKLSLTLLLIGELAFGSFAYAQTATKASQLDAAVNGSWRAPENRVRDKYRHPLETLKFFGVRPDATLIELYPGGKAYYAEILAPFLHDHGQYIAVNSGDEQENVGQKAKFAADNLHFGKVKIITLTPSAIEFGPDNSADYFVTFRNVHNFAEKDNGQEKLFRAIFKVLKPGGVLGIEDHRAAAGKSFDEIKTTGYLPEAFVIAEAKKAGFKLEASSDINNNPKDTKNYPKGVWTLPPSYAEGDKDRAIFSAIGESDRMTLRFVKPKNQ